LQTSGREAAVASLLAEKNQAEAARVAGIDVALYHLIAARLSLHDLFPLAARHWLHVTPLAWGLKK
jgi:hypothetical protein